MGTVRYSADALEDLAGLRAYIAQHNPAAAQRVALRIVQVVKRLETFPMSGKSGRVAGTRELVIQRFPYTIVYQVSGRDCMVLRVLHQAMQWPPLG